MKNTLLLLLLIGTMTAAVTVAGPVKPRARKAGQSARIGTTAKPLPPARPDRIR